MNIEESIDAIISQRRAKVGDIGAQIDKLR